MRIRIAKFITVFVILLNFIAVYFIWKLLSSHSKIKVSDTVVTPSPIFNESLGVKKTSKYQNEVTFIIRAFEHFDHDIVDTVRSVLNIYPNATVLIVADTPVYPPIVFNTTNFVKFVNLKIRLTNTFKDRTPNLLIKNKYVFFIPDSTRINSKKLLEKLINLSTKEPDKIIAVPYKGTKEVKCLSLHLNIREWLIRFDEPSPTRECDSIKGKHALFINTQVLFKMPDPFMLPFPDALYIQSASKYIKVTLADDVVLNNGRELFKSRHNQWKMQQLERERQRSMYNSLELKKVIKENGVIEWYGCRRDTQRCFGSIVDETPDYLWEGKWTPPCCLAGLRQTARHVLEQLEEARVRYWLEGGSLLGAMRGGDILPWDYDIDIGIYREDITRCTWLLRATDKPITDPQGFVWEKAVEGDFYRVQFSQINRLHVDIFPFYSRNGTMTKDTWFKTHPQDREFPEYYLKPLSTIDFIGRTVSAPNNIHDFLEFKFGEGAIENPEYPNPYKMAIHGLSRGPVGS
ncbi:fukutin-related protein [Homalodisca vitripennis]|uniref:fukutin-related protein n=1 Tax=Homalodisca vitripennis TaxID=197043 RepID=UPI001EEBD19A|nr:fukutin-related protein [Homalodisca vitripennis]